MKIRPGIISVARETYTPSPNWQSFEHYAFFLQKIADDFKYEQELEKVNTFMKGKWLK